ncbi:MAG: hypothetical protein ACRC2S_25675 [Waterburya sp.]
MISLLNRVKHRLLLDRYASQVRLLLPYFHKKRSLYGKAIAKTSE